MPHACYAIDVSQPLPLDQAVEALKRDPTHAVRARVGDMTVELRAVPDSTPVVVRSAADVLREIGCWEGETYDELVGLFEATVPASGDGLDPLRPRTSRG
jgi:hypothetical protein